jgi:hypothetical protein
LIFKLIMSGHLGPKTRFTGLPVVGLATFFT